VPHSHGKHLRLATRCHLAVSGHAGTVSAMGVVYNKLVRDKIPEIIAAAESSSSTSIKTEVSRVRLCS
jgi:hypothetical protein